MNNKQENSSLPLTGKSEIETAHFMPQETFYERDESSNLLRTFVYDGPGIDEPICMIDPTETMYYYHFDGLGPGTPGLLFQILMVR